MSAELRCDHHVAGAFGGNANPQPASLRWLAYYTTPRHEKAVAKHFECRSVDYFLPLVRQSRRWKNGVRAQVDQPLFPGYVFARLEPKRYFQVLNIPGVLSVVGPAHKPSMLEDDEIESLRAGLAERNSRPHPFLVIGQRARITSGAFAGKTGILVREVTNLRVVLTVEAIMKSFSVEVDAGELEMVS
jgi:transcription antitermination factor NusG